MSNLYYTVSYGAGTSIINGKVEELPKELKKAVEKGLNIQVFGDVIHPNNAKSPFFKCRNLLAVIGCEYIGTDRDDKSIREAHVSEACNIVDSLGNGKVKDLVIVNYITFDKSNEELSEALKYLYEIVTSATKEKFNSSDNVTVYWDLNDEEKKLVEVQKEWNSSVHLDTDNYVILTHK